MTPALDTRKEVRHAIVRQEEGQGRPEGLLNVSIRPASGDELRLVQSTWTRTLLQLPMDDDGRTEVGGPLKVSRSKVTRSRVGGMMVERRVLVWSHRLMVDAIIAADDTAIAVAHLPEIDEPAGWACWQGPLLHFVWVHRAARKAKIATQLVIHSGCSAASHVTPEGRGLLRHLRGRSR